MLIALTLMLTMLMLMGHLATCLAQPNNSKPQALLHLMINTDMYIHMHLHGVGDINGEDGDRDAAVLSTVV